jgi:hypothetical protein
LFEGHALSSRGWNVMAGGDTCTELEYEATHVHEVYEEIAGHFSATRYKVRKTAHAV